MKISENIKTMKHVENMTKSEIIIEANKNHKYLQKIAKLKQPQRTCETEKQLGSCFVLYVNHAAILYRSYHNPVATRPCNNKKQ